MLNLPSLTLKQGLKSDFNPHTKKDPKQLDPGQPSAVDHTLRPAGKYGLDHPLAVLGASFDSTLMGDTVEPKDVRETYMKE